MKQYRWTSVFGIGLFVMGMTTMAYADNVQGRVVSARSGELQLTVFDAQGRPYPNNIKLKVDNFTRFNNFSSMSALKKQDVVSAEVRQGRDALWRADVLTRLSNNANIPLAPIKPSPNLMDALKSPQGQNIIKRGLTGAMVGGAASGASGGKAGKGALIGAGAGILGGWLADILGGSAQAPQTTQAQPYVQSDSSDYRG